MQNRVGITRSVIVNALRKFESAGVIESRSSGMKGTYIKVLNDVVFDELARIRRQINHRNINKQNIKKSTRMVASNKGIYSGKSCKSLYIINNQLEKTLDNVK